MAGKFRKRALNRTELEVTGFITQDPRGPHPCRTPGDPVRVGGAGGENDPVTWRCRAAANHCRAERRPRSETIPKNRADRPTQLPAFQPNSRMQAEYFQLHHHPPTAV